MASVLDGATLEDLRKEAEKLRRSKESDMYYI
jgi:hypothetical protein